VYYVRLNGKRLLRRWDNDLYPSRLGARSPPVLPKRPEVHVVAEDDDVSVDEKDDSSGHQVD